MCVMPLSKSVRTLFCPASEPSPNVVQLDAGVLKHADTCTASLASWDVYTKQGTKRVQQQLLYFKSMQPRVVFGVKVHYEESCPNMHFPWLYGDVYLAVTVTESGSTRAKNSTSTLYDYDSIFKEYLDVFLQRYCEYKRVLDEYGGIEYGLSDRAVQRIETYCHATQTIPYDFDFVFRRCCEA